MSGTQPQYAAPGPARLALTLNPNQVPAFTADDMKADLQGAPQCSLGPTLSDQPPTVESVEFVACKELTNRFNGYIGLADDALVCHVVLRGPFRLRCVSPSPGHPGGPVFSETVEEI